MTIRDVVNTMLRYLRSEQRTIPHTNTDYDDPLPDAVAAINAALQQISVLGPYSAVKQGRAAYFRAPATVAVSALTRGGTTCTITGAASYMAGCEITLPGDSNKNRIIKISGTTATLQFPHLSDTAAGDAALVYDAAELPADIITVHEPVRTRGSTTTKLRAASGRYDLSENAALGLAYYIEVTTAPGGIPKLRMMLSGAPTTELVVEFQARVSLGSVSTTDVYGDAPGYADPGVVVPVPAGFTEAIFVPIALDLFFASPSITNFDISSLRNQDSVKLIREQAAAARELLANMKPQGRKPLQMTPWG